jgi:hypothetical protein
MVEGMEALVQNSRRAEAPREREDSQERMDIVDAAPVNPGRATRVGQVRNHYKRVVRHPLRPAFLVCLLVSIPVSTILNNDQGSIRRDFRRLLGCRSYRSDEFIHARRALDDEELALWSSRDPDYQIAAGTFRYDFEKKCSFAYNKAAIHFFVEQFIEKTTREENPWYSDPELPDVLLTRGSVTQAIHSHIRYAVDAWKIANGEKSDEENRERLNRVGRNTRRRLVSVYCFFLLELSLWHHGSSWRNAGTRLNPAKVYGGNTEFCSIIWTWTL